MSARKGGLGRGLDALIPTSIIPTEIKTQTGVIAAGPGDHGLHEDELVQYRKVFHFPQNAPPIALQQAERPYQSDIAHALSHFPAYAWDHPRVGHRYEVEG